MITKSRILFAALVGIVVALCLPAAASAGITEYSVPTPGAGPFGITTGPDGALWFTEFSVDKIGRVTPAGDFSEYPIPTPGADPTAITAGPDGALWFTEVLGGKIGRITTSGQITEFTPSSPIGPLGIAAGSDGALWFTEGNNRIGRITTAGAFTFFAIPTPASNPYRITAGPDGALWFTENGVSKIGRITTAGSISEFPTPTPATFPIGITAGPDGAIWFTEDGSNSIGRVTTGGGFTEFPIPTPSSFPFGITGGPDGAVWFAEASNGAHQIGRITTAGEISEFPLATLLNAPGEITAGPDGAVWFTEGSNGANKIGRITAEGSPTATTVACAEETMVAGHSTTCTATVTDTSDGGLAAPTGEVTFASDGFSRFSGGGSCTLSAVNGSSASCAVTYSPNSAMRDPVVRTDSITASYHGDSRHFASNGTTSVKVLSIELLASGSFVIGDRNAAIGKAVTFWGSQWSKQNRTSGGPAATSFKGFASQTPSNPPRCGDRWTTGSGNGSSAPSAVPDYMAVIASSAISRTGSTVSGDVAGLVVVRVDPGYAPEPGHAGTATVVATVC
jgi:virginiamycin B lyase